MTVELGPGGPCGIYSWLWAVSRKESWAGWKTFRVSMVTSAEHSKTQAFWTASLLLVVELKGNPGTK